MDEKKESHQSVKGKFAMRFCSKCNCPMVDVACYDPEGTVPLVMEADSDGRVWACIQCSSERGISEGESEGGLKCPIN